MLELEKLAISLEGANSEGGEALLKSFEEMLQQLSDGIDRGVEQTLQENRDLENESK